MGARGYGMNLRERIVLAVREGMAVEEAAQQYRVHLQTVQRYLNQGDQGLLGVYVKPSGRPCTLQTEHEQQLLQQLDEHTDATLVEHARNRDGPERELQNGRPGVHATENHL